MSSSRRITVQVSKTLESSQAIVSREWHGLGNWALLETEHLTMDLQVTMNPELPLWPGLSQTFQVLKLMENVFKCLTLNTKCPITLNSHFQFLSHYCWLWMSNLSAMDPNVKPLAWHRSCGGKWTLLILAGPDFCPCRGIHHCSRYGCCLQSLSCLRSSQRLMLAAVWTTGYTEQGWKLGDHLGGCGSSPDKSW